MRSVAEHADYQITKAAPSSHGSPVQRLGFSLSLRGLLFSHQLDTLSRDVQYCTVRDL